MGETDLGHRRALPRSGDRDVDPLQQFDPDVIADQHRGTEAALLLHGGGDLVVVEVELIELREPEYLGIEADRTVEVGDADADMGEALDHEGSVTERTAGHAYSARDCVRSEEHTSELKSTMRIS